MSIAFNEASSTRQLLITQRLRERRCELGLTQKQVVTRLARCGLRTTNRALSSLEHGAGIEVAKLAALAVALDCSVTYLIGLTDDPHRWEPDHQPVAQPGRPPVAQPVATSRGPEVPRRSLILGVDVPDRDFRAGFNGRPRTP
jgi:transcriptional regulator with XRE-family HTH domain